MTHIPLVHFWRYLCFGYINKRMWFQSGPPHDHFVSFSSFGHLPSRFHSSFHLSSSRFRLFCTIIAKRKPNRQPRIHNGWQPRLTLFHIVLTATVKAEPFGALGISPTRSSNKKSNLPKDQHKHQTTRKRKKEVSVF